MINVSQAQLIDIWCDLEDAYNGCNGFGGDTAEIYAYKLYETNPLAMQYAYSPKKNSLMEQAFREVTFKAAESFFHLLKLFIVKRDCRIVIDKRKFGKWLAKEPLIHRVHVKIIRKKK